MAHHSTPKPIPTAILTPDVVARFHAWYTVNDAGCWIWKRLAMGVDYPRIKIKGAMYRAHRVSYVLNTGADVPPGLELDHLCRNMLCVNPEHLEAVTHQENVARGTAPSALAIRTIMETGRCLKGHDMTLPDSWVVREKYRYRQCRQCAYAHTRAYKAALVS